MKELIKQQKAVDGNWIDEQGNRIPLKRVTRYEKRSEREVYYMAKQAAELHKKLSDYKEDMINRCQSLFDEFLAENGKEIEDVKGNATFFNFDRSIKIEVKVNGLIEFDPNTIKLAQETLEEIFKDGMDGAKDWLKPIIMEAFRTTRGRLDTKRVLGLKRHADRVPDPRYAEAMKLIDKSMRNRDAKVYYQVSILNADNEYEVINLNFSKI